MTSAESLTQRFAREYPRGSVVFREGDPGGPMYVVQSGQVRISRRAGGAETVLTTLGPGAFFGEMSILSGRPRSATATCVEGDRVAEQEAGRPLAGELPAGAAEDAQLHVPPPGGRAA